MHDSTAGMSGENNLSTTQSPVTYKQFLRELALIIPVGLAITAITIYVIYPSLGISAQSPQPARTIIILAFLTWLIRKNKNTWGDMGLKSFRPLWLLPIFVVVFLAVQNFLAQPLGDALREFLDAPSPDRSFLNHIPGNPFILSAWLLMSWTVGAFAEEMICRGYILNRVGQVFGGRPLAWAIAVIVQALLFGFLHIYLGYGAAITISFKALFTGTFFLIGKRNLWPLIFVHGIWDTLGFTLVYLTGSPST